MKLTWHLFTFISSLILTSCTTMTTMSDVIKNKDNGTAKIYAVSKMQAVAITRFAFRKEGAEMIEERLNENYIMATAGPSGSSWGDNMAAWIEPIDDTHTKVTVVVKHRLTGNIGAPFRESGFHKYFSEGLAIIQSGKALPEIGTDSK